MATDWTCPKCGHPVYIGIEYEYGHPDRYDGMSERMCERCGTRYGRWTGRELHEGESEKRWGGER